jgi:UDP-N-acetylmuramate dehydrogenase
MSDDLYRKLKRLSAVETDQPLSKMTTLRIGGVAKYVVYPNSAVALDAVISLLKKENVPWKIIGKGSDLLCSDDPYDGVIIRLDRHFRSYYFDGCQVIAEAGASIIALSVDCAKNGLSGLEFASGIPGSIGGAVFMNAGAYGGEIKDVGRSVRVMDADGTNLRTVSGEDMQFSYRHSIAEDEGILILFADMELKEDSPEAIAARVAELQFKRNSKQPVNYPSAGSTFKRPAGGYAAALIEASGLKGYRSGGAEVSEKHSGFVINAGGATAEDVLSVMRHVREKVFADSGIMLEPEVRLINCSI